MRIPTTFMGVVFTTALCASLAGAATATTTTGAGTATNAAHAATKVVVVRPVTSSGAAVTGFHVKTQHDVSIDCSSRQPSAGAVDRNIEECSPSAAYAIACWKAATSHHALCTRDPSSHRLYRIALTGRFAKTPVVKAKWRAPLLIVLTDGTRCSIRDGGAWGTLKSHPSWNGTYSCTKHGIVWSAPKAKHEGVDESSSSWSVHTGSAAGTGKLTARHIERAYFVGTASR